MKRMLFMCTGIFLICTLLLSHKMLSQQTAIGQQTAISQQTTIGQTEITKWQYGKRGAISITYDGGSLNQFRKALPIMNRLNFPATFFIVTGAIPGSKYEGKFIGRDVKKIIAESATIPTNKDNFLERSSAASFLGYAGTLEYHTDAGNKFETGKFDEAYKIMDDLYAKVRKGDFPPGNRMNQEVFAGMGVTWDEIRTYAAQGHEMACHTITHPQMAALDDANLIYELEKSGEEIRNQLNLKYIFSAECPYATENERVMKFAFKYYPALRNRMPEPFLAEISRSNRKTPSAFNKEYVQWQRGTLTKTPLALMKAWVDTTAAKNNVWLVLAIHGVDGIGWESLTSESLDEYFGYMKSKEDDIWIATFADATKYMRERMSSSIKTSDNNGKISVNLTHTLDKTIYDIPLTLRTHVPSEWKTVQVKQGKETKQYKTQFDDKGSYVIYQAYPNSEIIVLIQI